MWWKLAITGLMVAVVIKCIESQEILGSLESLEGFTEPESTEQSHYNTENDDLTTTKSISLTELASSVNRIETELSQKMTLLEEEMELMKASNDEKMSAQLEHVKEELDQQLEQQRQDLSALMTPSQAGVHDDLNPCGGFVALEEQMDLTYENLDNSTEEKTCVYVIAGQDDGPINITLINLQYGHQNGFLGLHKIPQNRSSPSVMELTIKDIGEEFSVDDNAVILLFRSWGGQSFQLRLRVNSKYSSVMKIKASFLGRTPQEAAIYSYPTVSGRKYQAFEKRFVILKSFQNQTARISIDYIDINTNAYLAVYKYSAKKNKFLFIQRFMGSWEDNHDLKFKSDENMPMLLYFYSDSHMHLVGHGFRISYSYRNLNESKSSFWKPTQVQSSFSGKCGGLVFVLSYTELTYTNEGKSNQEEICVWILWSKINGGSIEVTLENGNFNSTSDGFEPKLSLQTESQLDSLTDGSVYSETVLSSNSAMDALDFNVDVSYGSVLTFVSKPGHSFRLGLRDMGTWDMSQPYKPNFTQIESNQVNQNYTLSHPQVHGKNYETGEIRFIYFKGFPDTTIHLSIDSLDIDEDSLNVYQFSGRHNNFRLYGRFNGHLNETVASTTCKSERGHGLLIYFSSKYSDTGLGFNITYSYDPSKEEIVGNLDSIDPETSNPCGGTVSLSNDTIEFIYVRDPDEHKNKSIDELICIWYLKKTTSSFLGLTLLNENNLNSINSTSFLSLHGGFSTGNETSVQFITVGENRRVLETISRNKFNILVFQMSSSSTSRQGFRLLVRQLGQVMSADDDKGQIEMELILKTSISETASTFSYPLKETEYLNRVNPRFFVLFPIIGQRIKIFVDYVNIITDYDKLKFYQFSNVTHNFELIQKSLLEERAVGSASTGVTRIFGKESCPVLLFYFPTYFEPGHGFSISYVSEPLVVPSKSNLAGVDLDRIDEILPVPCNEFLSISTATELVFRNPVNETEETTCVWVIQALTGTGGSLTFTLKNLNLTNLTSSLVIHQIYANQSSSFIRFLTSSDVGQTIRVSVPSVLITCRSQSGEGFHLDIDDDMIYVGDNVINADFLGQTNFHNASIFSYPSIYRGHYMHNERRYIVIKAMAGRNVSLSVDFVSTEKLHDILTVFKFSKNRDKFLYLQRYTGSHPALTTAKFQGDENEPMLLYFSSDSSVNDMGFRISFSYSLPNATVGKIWRQTQIQQTFEKCGGLIEIPKYNEISYTNTENSTDELTCVWILSATNNGRYGIELESLSSVGSQEISRPANLSLQTELLYFVLKKRIITTNDMRNEIQAEHLSILVFTSRPGQSFSLGLRELSQRRLYAPNIVNFNNVEKKTEDQIPFQFAYPSTPGHFYVANEHRFVLVDGRPGKFINLSIDYVDLTSSNDILRIYKFISDVNEFQFYGRFSGQLGELNGTKFQGEEGNPILFYFTSNNYGHGHGFIFSFIYENFTRNSTTRDIIEAGVSGQCGGIVIIENCKGLVQDQTEAVDIAYKNRGQRRGQEICIWVITGTNEGVLSHTLIEQNFGNDSDALTIQKGILDGTLYEPMTVKLSSLFKEVVYSDKYFFLIFKSNETGQGFSLRLREYGMSKHVTDSFTLHRGHVIRLQSQESGSYSQLYPRNVSKVEEDRLFIILQPFVREVVSLDLTFVQTDSTDAFYVLKFSTMNNSLVLLHKSISQFSMATHFSFQGKENEPLIFIYHYSPRRPTYLREFNLFYTSQPISSIPVQVNNSVSNLNSTTNSDVEKTFGNTNSCGGLVHTPANLQYKNTRQDDQEEICVWIVISKIGQMVIVPQSKPYMTWTLLTGNLTTTLSSLSIQQNIGNQKTSISRLIREEDTGVLIPIKKLFAILVFNSRRKGQGFQLKIEDSSQVQITSDRQNDVKLIFNYIGGWPNQTYGTFSYPSSQVTDSFYSNQERRILILRGLPQKIIRLSIDFVSLEETQDDFLEIYKFSKNDNKFLFIQRFTGDLGHNLKDSVFDSDVGQFFLLYFETDQFFQGKGFKLSYSYHEYHKKSETSSNRTTTKPYFATDFCRKFSSCSECVKNKCEYTGQEPFPCRGGDELKELDERHYKFRPPLKTLSECHENVGIKPNKVVQIETHEQLSSLEIAGIVSLIVISLLILVTVGCLIYIKSCLQVSRTSGPDGPSLSISERRDTETIRLVDLQ